MTKLFSIFCVFYAWATGNNALGLFAVVLFTGCLVVDCYKEAVQEIAEGR